MVHEPAMRLILRLSVLKVLVDRVSKLALLVCDGRCLELFQFVVSDEESLGSFSSLCSIIFPRSVGSAMLKGLMGQHEMEIADLGGW